MKHPKFAKMISILLGLFLIGYAANQFLHVLPTSYGEMPDFTRQFLDSIITFLPVLFIFEMLIGLLLVFNKWVPFISVVLAPLSISFMIFNIANGDWNIISAIVVAVLNVILLFEYKEKYMPLFS